jgi:hypothetical protein
MPTFECPECGWEYEEPTNKDHITMVCKGECRDDKEEVDLVRKFEQV